MPEKTSMNFLSFDRSDGKLAVVMATLMITAEPYYGKLATLVVVGLWLGLMWRREDGRNYWLFAGWCANLWITRVEKNVIWTAKKKRWSDIFRRSPPINLKLGELGDLGLVHVVSRKTDSIIILGEGSDSSAQSLEALHAYNLANADTIKRVAAVPGYGVGTSFVFRRRLANLSRVATGYSENLDPEVAIPRALTIPADQHTAYDRRKMGLRLITQELTDMVETYSGEVRMAAVLTIRREGLLAGLKKGGSLATDEINRLPIAKVARTAIDGFSANGVAEVRALDFAGVHAYIHGALDVANAGSYYSRQDDPTDNVYDSGFPGPEHEILAFKDHCITDDTWHSVIKLTRCPAASLPNYFHQLHATNVRWPAVTLVGDAVGSGFEYTLLDRIIPLKESLDESLGVVHKGPRGRERDEGLVTRQDEIYRSRIKMTYSILVGISQTSLRSLEDDVSEAINLARSLGLGPRRIKGPSKQVSAILTASTGVNLM